MNRLKCNNILQIANWLRETSHKEQLFEEQSSLRKEKLCPLCKPKICNSANRRFARQFLFVQTEGLHQCKPLVCTAGGSCKQSRALLSFAYKFTPFVLLPQNQGAVARRSSCLKGQLTEGAVARRGRWLCVAKRSFASFCLQCKQNQQGYALQSGALHRFAYNVSKTNKIGSKTLELQISDLHEPPAPSGNCPTPSVKGRGFVSKT